MTLSKIYQPTAAAQSSQHHYKVSRLMPCDIEACYAFHLKTFHAQPKGQAYMLERPKDFFETHLKGNEDAAIFALLDEQERIAAMCVVSPLSDEDITNYGLNPNGSFAAIKSVSVDPDKTRQGLMKEIVIAAIEHIENHAFDGYVARVATQNAASQKAFRHCWQLELIHTDPHDLRGAVDTLGTTFNAAFPLKLQPQAVMRFTAPAPSLPVAYQ